MTQVRLSSKYQVVIPEAVRHELDLTPGRLFEVFAFGGSLRVVPVRPLGEAFGLLARLAPRAAAAVPSDPRDQEGRLRLPGGRG